MGTRRREPPGGWPSGIETVPLRDHAAEAPAEARRGENPTRPEEPVPVRAWITQHQSGSHRVAGYAIAWTSQQVQVRYLDGNGREGWAWLWANAVARR